MRRTAYTSLLLVFTLVISVHILGTQFINQTITVDADSLDSCSNCNKNHQSNYLVVSNSDAELEEIKDAISEKGAKWIADETSASQLSFEDRKKLCSTKIDPPPENIERITSPLRDIPYGTFDWRNENGNDWMTPIRSQGSCGSCWAFGTLGSMEAVINIEYNNPGLDMDLSEQTLASCSGAGSCSGGSPMLAYNYIMSSGLPDEACFPYVASNAECEICDDWEERAWFITSWSYVSNDTNSIKWALQNYGPLGAAMFAPDDFLFYSSGIYEPVWSSEEWNEEFSGLANHWITIAGYDDAQSYWIIKNSWGTWWGEEGYGKIAYGVLEGYNCIYAIHGVRGTLGSKGILDATYDFIDAPENNAYFVYPDYEGDKPPGTSYAKLSDWTAAGYVIGMCSNIQIEATDTNSGIIDSNNGSPKLTNKTIVLFGGPIVNAPVRYYENSRIAPVYYRNVGGVNYWYRADGTRLDETALTFSQINSGQDMFVVESFTDNSDNNIYIVYGYGWKGTFAGGKFFKFVIHPNIESYTDSYYVFKWNDDNSDGFVDLNEIITTPVTSG